MTIIEFCDKHAACAGGREWALATDEPDMAALWKRTDIKPEWRVWIATRDGVLDDRTLRLFGCWSVRKVWHLLTDERSRNAVIVAERFADGKATEEELAAARVAASAAVSGAAWAASDASDAARDAAGDAAGDAARGASDAAWDAACGAAVWDTAEAAAGAAAGAAAWAAQSSWLIANTKPSFEG